MMIDAPAMMNEPPAMMNNTPQMMNEPPAMMNNTPHRIQTERAMMNDTPGRLDDSVQPRATELASAALGAERPLAPPRCRAS